MEHHVRHQSNDIEMANLILSKRSEYVHSLSSWLQAIPPSYYTGLVEAMSLRAYCHSDRSTYEPIAPRSVSLSSRHAAMDVAAQRISQAENDGNEPATDNDLDVVTPVWASPLRDVRLGGSVRRTVERPRNGLLLAPVPVPVQEDLCRFWIERRVGIELDPGIPLVEALADGHILCKLLGIESVRPVPNGPIPFQNPELLVTMFFRRAVKKGLKRRELFELNDLIHRRNVPRVLRTIAAIARTTDPEGFSAVAADLPGSRLQWTQADEPDELWNGDWMISKIVKTHQSLSWRRKLSIMVAGSQGSGKSATIDMLMGRQFTEPSHALRFMPPDSFFCEEEQQLMQRYRQSIVRNCGVAPFERGTPTFLDETSRMYVKLSGVSVQAIELPSMEGLLQRRELNGAEYTFQAGKYEEVLKSLRDDEIDVVLLVERLDDFSFRRLNDAYRKLHRLFGDMVWTRTICVLTHGYVLPPPHVSYEEFVEERKLAAQTCVRRVSGDPSATVPVVVVENSSSCPKDPATCRPKLPNGLDFQMSLLGAMEQLLVQHERSDPLRCTDGKEWWESYAFAAVICFLLSRL